MPESVKTSSTKFVIVSFIIKCVFWYIISKLSIYHITCHWSIVPGSCGIRPSTRIVGGARARPGDWPWQAQIRSFRFGSPFCGGSLISPQWVVSASHCYKSSLYVRWVDELSIKCIHISSPFWRNKTSHFCQNSSHFGSPRIEYWKIFNSPSKRHRSVNEKNSKSFEKFLIRFKGEEGRKKATRERLFFREIER